MSGVHSAIVVSREQRTAGDTACCPCAGRLAVVVVIDQENSGDLKNIRLAIM
ncbi:hypothetical protein [Burkholderia sp. USMB20]|uniref:hypothetical protein n=1 Tax=Burkholderia sp. USMB20 TaxID=1571773 RepID=UPI000AE7CE4A|nr:hypothetical protein [Burkholderia sp. USMB20]